MLTDAKVRPAKPRPKSYKLVDANRLFLMVTPNGGKLWRREACLVSWVRLPCPPSLPAHKYLKGEETF